MSFCSGVGGVDLQSVTTILEDFNRLLNCPREPICTVFDMLDIGAGVVC